VYKNKGDAQACGNYRRIKLLSHTMNLWERVIEKRNQTRGDDQGTPIWFYAREINH
jgi:hypothetical protein